MSASKTKPKKNTLNETSKTAIAHCCTTKKDATSSEPIDDTISDSEKTQMIAEAAYYKAEKREFCSCDEEKLMDWLEAETEINSQLSEEKTQSP